MGIKTGIACIALALSGCAHKSPPPPEPPITSIERAELADLQRTTELACEQVCERAVLGECVLRAVEQPVEDDCVRSRSLACLLNCAP